MKFFQSIQRILSHVGIDPNQSTRTHPFNARNSKNCLIFLVACICSIVFLFHEASSVEERMESGFLTGLTILNLMCFINLIFKMKLVYNYFDNAEKIVEQSELLHLDFNHTSDFEQTFCRIGNFIIESSLRGNVTIDWKIQWNHILDSCEIDSNSVGIPQINFVHFSLFSW